MKLENLFEKPHNGGSVCYNWGMNDERELVINWFPGHMASALRMISDQLKLCNVIIYVLDARCAVSSLNPKFDSLVDRKPVLFVLNKIDLAPPNTLSSFLQNEQVKKIYSRKGEFVHTVTLDSTTSGTSKKVTTAVEKILQSQILAAKEKGITKTIRAIVIGVTNCGKSTLINNLANKGKTQTGDKPGVTKTKQWVATIHPHFYLLDTPGTLFPALDNQKSTKNLAYAGSIRDEAIDFIALAKHLLVDLERLRPGCINARFGATEFNDICKKRGYIIRGGLLDEERAAKAILTEFRSGKIGKFNLDELNS